MANEGRGWWWRVAGSLLLLAGIAIGARLIWEVLSPLLPVLLLGVGLVVVWAVVLRSFRR